MPTALHICPTEGSEGNVLRSGAGVSDHGVKTGGGLSFICFLHCGGHGCGGGPRFSKKRVHERMLV